MYFQFSNFTGRLTGSSHIQPYFPMGVQPLERREPPEIIFPTKNEKMVKIAPPVRQASQRSVVPGTNMPYGEVPESLKRKMELFQKKDGIPVHLKGGPMDKALFGLTIALCGIGLFECFRFYYEMAKPKK